VSLEKPIKTRGIFFTTLIEVDVMWLLVQTPQLDARGSDETKEALQLQ